MEFDEFEESEPSKEAYEGDFDLNFACPPGERPDTIPEEARIEVEPEPRAPEARTFRHAPNALEELAEPAKIWIAAQTRPSMEAMLRHVMCATADMLVPGAGAAVSIGFRVERLWGVARSFLDGKGVTFKVPVIADPSGFALVFGVTVGDEREHPPSPFTMDLLFDPIAPRQPGDWRPTASPDTPGRPVDTASEAAVIVKPLPGFSTIIGDQVCRCPDTER